MARKPTDMAEKLIEIYKEIKSKYLLSKEDFKRIAGKEQLRDSYLSQVDAYLREDGYILIDLRNERDKIGIIKIKAVLKWTEVPADIIEKYEEEDWIEE